LPPPEAGGRQDGGGGRDPGGDPQGLGVAGSERRPPDHLVAEASCRRQDRDRQQPPELADGVVGARGDALVSVVQRPSVALVSGGPNRAVPEATTSSPGSTSATNCEPGPMPLSSHSPPL
jgi:hypothetical protein